MSEMKIQIDFDGAIFRLCFKYRHWKKAYAVGALVTPEIVAEYQRDAEREFAKIEAEHEERIRRKWQQ